MSTTQSTERIEFFSDALAICARHGRSPQAALTVRGQAHTLRQVLKAIGAGARLPRITEAEARRLARTHRQFSYAEILIGFGARATSAIRGRRQPRRSRRARR